MGDPDQALMLRLQQGDESAFEVLVHRYEGMILSLCRRYLGSRYAGVEDVAQQILLRIHRGRMGYEPRAKVKTWIFAVAVNACLNEIRSLRSGKQRRIGTFTALFGDEEGSEPPGLEDPAAPVPGEGGIEASVAARVRAAVDALPEQQRLAVVLTRFHNCSYEDTAEAMATTVSAVKSLLTRARENLRRALADLADEPSPAPRVETEKPPPPRGG